MKRVFYLIFILLIISSCEDDDIPYVFPLDYFPAYPESYWVYSDGTTMKVAPGYHKYQYYIEMESTETSDEKYVPMIDGHYVDEYYISQDDNRVPRKKLLSETLSEHWVIGYYQGGQMKRQVLSINKTISLSNPISGTNEQSFDSCIMVQEYFLENGTASPWYKMDYFAPKVGLIKQEIQRDGDTIVLKELVDYYISQDI